MLNLTEITTAFLGIAFAAATFHGQNISSAEGKNATSPRYLRVSTAHWSISTYSPEAERIIDLIKTDGLDVFRAQPGFINYRLMRVDSTMTIAVAEWESEELGLAGAEKYRSWMRTVGIMDLIKLETHTGEIVVDS